MGFEFHVSARTSFLSQHKNSIITRAICGSTSLKMGSVSIPVFFVGRYCNYCAIPPDMLGEPAACLSEYIHTPLRVLSFLAFGRVIEIYLIVDEKCSWQVSW